jgi:Arc/MetJ-type ribon-helix-helix transcriptional regulator
MRDMSNSKKSHLRVSWYNMDHWLMNGFALPATAHSALAALVRLGRFPSLEIAIRQGIRMLLEENAALLARSDHKWMQLLADMDGIFKDPKEPDVVGKANIRLLEQMYKAMAKVEK